MKYEVQYPPQQPVPQVVFQYGEVLPPEEIIGWSLGYGNTKTA